MVGENGGATDAAEREAWARTHLSQDGYTQWAASQQAAAQTQMAGGSSGGMYQWSDGRWSSMPEPQVNWATGYQAGSPTGVSYGGRIPYSALLSQGIANLNNRQMELLIQAASNMAGYDARKNLGSTLPVAWEYAVNRASSMGIDPMEVLAWVARDSLGARFGSTEWPQVDLSSSSSSSYGGGGGGGGGGTTTVTTTQITNPDTAKRLINQAMSSYLGREATQQELQRFIKSLNAEERANPTVQTMTMDGSGQSQTVTGGMDQAQFAQTYAESRPDYAEYRAATDLMQAFLGVLQGPVR